MPKNQPCNKEPKTPPKRKRASQMQPFSGSHKLYGLARTQAPEQLLRTGSTARAW